jgi:hypothetical protein
VQSDVDRAADLFPSSSFFPIPGEAFCARDDSRSLREGKVISIAVAKMDCTAVFSGRHFAHGIEGIEDAFHGARGRVAVHNPAETDEVCVHKKSSVKNVDLTLD